MSESTLVRINITYDYNDDGERTYLVTPIYRRNGQVMSIPDSRGWKTLTEAKLEAERIGGGTLEPIYG